MTNWVVGKEKVEWKARLSPTVSNPSSPTALGVKL